MVTPESSGLDNFPRWKKLQERANLGLRALGAWLGHVRVRADGSISDSKWTCSRQLSLTGRSVMECAVWKLAVDAWR